MFQLGNAHFRHPVIQAPMAGSQDNELALAVGRAGGLGSLPCAMLSLDKLEQELQALRSLESYNLNFFCHDEAAAELTRNAEKIQHWQQLLQPFYEAWEIAPPDPMTPASRQPYSAAQAELLAAYRPPVVSFHFGVPKATLLRQIKSWGSAVISTPAPSMRQYTCRVKGWTPLSCRGWRQEGTAVISCAATWRARCPH